MFFTYFEDIKGTIMSRIAPISRYRNPVTRVQWMLILVLGVLCHYLSLLILCRVTFVYKTVSVVRWGLIDTMLGNTGDWWWYCSALWLELIHQPLLLRLWHQLTGPNSTRFSGEQGQCRRCASIFIIVVITSVERWALQIKQVMMKGLETLCCFNYTKENISRWNNNTIQVSWPRCLHSSLALTWSWSS